MYKCILIPTDGSEFSERAIRTGVALAKLLNAKVIGLTVAQPLNIGSLHGQIPETMASTIRSQAVAFGEQNLAVIENAAKEADIALDTIQSSQDHPWQAIIQTAKDKRCDLIVMASHGRRGLSAMILGSETQKVVTHANIPVLVVR